MAATILTLDNVSITSPTYAITGQIRYEDVEGSGYLELWSHFPDGRQHFTRTLASVGPTRSIQGSSGWRPFVLPFFVGKSTARPQKLVVNVVLPERGRVFLGPSRLVQYGPGETPLKVAEGWWDDRTGGLIGGILGALGGCFGTLIGLLVYQGKARGFVVWMLQAAMLLGIALLLLGFIALARSQPYAVYYPLLLLGLLFTVIPAANLCGVRRRYEEIEMRKMSAQDAV